MAWISCQECGETMECVAVEGDKEVWKCPKCKNECIITWNYY